ncbi:MAG: SDR family oxidoreductase [Candidatus Marinimicrobia bacterium]|nr:SDR family oxidoreductase [Candidatus Neomarinimicrobiota bacterium]MDD5581633.1 SDR family oxidoreductase [Candidatus Neomarinimicrobiota bacterium]
MDLHLHGKKAIVLAGTKGIGYAIAECLVKEGATVAIGSRNLQNIHAAEKKLMKLGDVIGFQVDVSTDFTSTLEWVFNQLMGIDILVVNCGGPVKGTFEQVDDEAWQKGLDSTLFSAIRSIRWAAEKMKKNKSGGRILVVTSMSAKQPMPDLVISNVIRSGLTSMTKTLAHELGPYKIAINNLLPGFVETDRLKSLSDTPDIRKAWLDRTALKRFADPAELGRVGAFLCSEAASYITGTDILVDGGAVHGI